MTKQLLTSLLLYSSIYASELDLGLGMATFHYPDYLGSNKQNMLIFPYPYLLYKSDTLEVDNAGLQQELLTYDDLRVEVSLSGALPAKSSGVREGMPKLDPSGEIGPALFYTMYDKDDALLELEFPLRAVLSTNFQGIDYNGYIYEAKFRASYTNRSGYLFQLGTGGIWGDERYHNYLYGVSETFVTKSRPYYKAKAGYTGYKTSFGIKKTFNEKLLIAGFIRHYNLADSRIENSPLKVKNSAIYGGVSFAYLFDQEISNRVKRWIEE